MNLNRKTITASYAGVCPNVTRQLRTDNDPCPQPCGGQEEDALILPLPLAH
jgi:hypothetical protein